jgi:hypothetical protein
VRLEGGLLGPDILERLQEGALPGQKPADFDLSAGRSLVEEIAAVFQDARDLYHVFRRGLDRLLENDPATTLTRERWMIPFLGLLGYELRYNSRSYELGGQLFAVSHRAGENEDAPPVHIVGARRSLDRVDPSGRPRVSPHALLQEFLNRSDHLWGIVTNGLELRLLRRSTLLRRQAYVAFDLEAIFEEERFIDFVLLYRLLHRTRLPKGIEDAPTCWLERYHEQAVEQGNRARDRLRDGVEKCLILLANGFLRHRPATESVRAEELYRDLLRLVYRFLFLLVTEERGLLSGNDLYREHYSITRLKRLVDRREAYTNHDDLWCGLRVLWHLLRDSTPVLQADGKPLASLLGLPVLDGGLFEDLALESWTISNRDLLEAFRHLVYYYDEETHTLRRVNYAALDVEELGSVYESLLDNHPVILDHSAGKTFDFAQGTERKSTGSYYTPEDLVAELVRSALEPAITERLEWAQRVARGEWRAVRNEIHQLLGEAYARSILSRLRDLAESHGTGRAGIRSYQSFPSRGEVRINGPDAPSRSVDPREHRRGMGEKEHPGIPPISQHRIGEPSGAGDLRHARPKDRFDETGTDSTPARPDPDFEPSDRNASTPSEKAIDEVWNALPLATRPSLLAEHALLSLRVLDPACGSGHFLLAAARRLGRELARVRTGEDEPSPEALREAVRDVIAHCIYGVDKNPLAVELCKVALWIESQVPGRPLTFLDHRIRCGDSLVGVFDLEVLRQGIPDEAYDRDRSISRTRIRALKERNQRERAGQRTLNPGAELEEDLLESALAVSDLERTPDDSAAVVAEKARRYRELQSRLERQRLACDLWTAAFFWDLTGGDPPTTDAVRRALENPSTLRGDLAGRARELAERHRFFHWPLEFPEVFVEGGFDVVLGNPPFMGGLKISGSLGDQYRHWLEVAYEPYGGTADLCAVFYRRAYSLLKPGGRMGLVATNTIGQGDTRESGLAVILRQGGVITFAKRFIKWPGAANVEVNLVAIEKPASRELQVASSQKQPHTTPHSPLATRHSPILDGQPVPFISSRLDAEPEAEPERLNQNEGKAFIGDYVRGIGFVLGPEEAEALLAKDPRNADCLFPYLNGEDLNSHPEQKPSRWVICFHDWDLERAKQYPDLLRIVEERVKPERERLRGPGDKRNREYWWQFGAYRAGMRRAIAPLRRVLVRSRVSELHAMVFVPLGWIYNEQLVVFAFDDDYHFALLQSSVHEVWLRKQASSLRTDVRYTPTDCFDTFPFPAEEYRRVASSEWRVEALQGSFAEAARIGAEYHEHRRQIMLRRWIGLTKTYNLFHDPACTDADIVRLRELHAEMDRVVLTCYGWEDINLHHSFYPNDRGQMRFTISPEARREVLHRLLELNLELSGG